ncbi:MAG: DUF6922 domain-containing protein [bacterium]
MTKIPQEWHQYFWEVLPENVDLEKNDYYIMGRVLEYGNLEAVRKLHRYYGEKRLRAFLQSTSSRVLSNKTMRFWQVVLNLSPSECEQISSIRGKHRLWPY